MLNLKQVPFSTYGSYLAISRLENRENLKNGLYLKSVHGQERWLPQFRIELFADGEDVPFIETAKPHMLRMESRGGYVEMCFAECRLLRIKGKGAGIRFVMEKPGTFGSAYPFVEKRWEINAYSHKMLLTSLVGALKVNAPWKGINCEHIIVEFIPDPLTLELEAAIEEYATVWSPRQYCDSFEASCNKVHKSYEAWLEKTLKVPAEFSQTRQEAAYIQWSSVVEPYGYLTRPAMLMSKNWMNSVWSWDHCFNAMALLARNPELAWDQMMLILDLQNSEGAFPDCINDSQIIWNFVKPPIHGWAMQWMMQRSENIGISQLEGIYSPLCRWTEWWFAYMDYDRDGIPQYNHGNDSGWDNSTVFKEGVPVESPDLSALLVLQMEFLSSLAGLLGKTDEMEHWNLRAGRLLKGMIKHFWEDGKFVAKHTFTHKTIDTRSLQVFLPLMLGKRLPEEILQSIVSKLKEEGGFLTEYGLATESTCSEFYTPDGYWRGPIWAPTTLMMVEALKEIGEVVLARELALRFCRMVKSSGMAENFNALTGEGLRDRAYTWTSSVFLILANELLKEEW